MKNGNMLPEALLKEHISHPAKNLQPTRELVRLGKLVSRAYRFPWLGSSVPAILPRPSANGKASAVRRKGETAARRFLSQLAEKINHSS